MAECDLPQRKNSRLKGFDYSQNGCYFATVCTDNRKKLFGDIVGGDDLGAPKKIELKPFGKVVENYILSIEKAYGCVSVENFIIMPNHIHLLIMIKSDGTPGSSSPTLSDIISALKKLSNKDCNYKLWQRGYYDHVIRNQTEYENAWQYIEYNALKSYK